MHLRFRPDHTVTCWSEEAIAIGFRHQILSYKNPSPELRQLLHSLLFQNRSREELLAEWIGEESGSFFYLLELFAKHGLLSYGTSFARLLPLTGAALQLVPLPGEPFLLSRFAYIRRSKEGWQCETPLSSALVLIEDLGEILFSLEAPQTVETLLDRFPSISKDELEIFLRLLESASLLSGADGSDSLASWEFHDLLFHTRSRIGRHSHPTGATFRWLDKRPALPAVRPKRNGGSRPLWRPDLGKIGKEERSLTAILEKRRSIRKQGDPPITIEQLGEFLYRAARIQESVQTPHYEVTHRPSPGAGGCHALEIYPLIYQCKGAERGLYLYDPQDHTLSLRTSWNEDLEELLTNAQRSTNKQEPPQIVLILAARFERLSWKYASIAYALLLKDVGALMQTMYLVATAMELAPCAIGCGNADLFAKAVGGDYYEEGSVGEFLLGSR